MSFKVKRKGRFLFIESSRLKVQLNVLRGMAIHALSFKKIHKEPLLGTLEQGFYNDIRLGSDFYSAHSVMEIPGQHKITDLNPCTFKTKQNKDSLSVECEIPFGSGQLKKTFSFDSERSGIKVRYQFSLEKLPPHVLRTAFLTLNPQVFDAESLYYACHNGGDDLEVFSLQNVREIDFGRPISHLISSRLVLGATKGYLEFGDSEKKIIVQSDPGSLAGLPSLHYLRLGNNQLLRFFYSLGEIDETSLLQNAPSSSELDFEILIHAENHVSD